MSKEIEEVTLKDHLTSVIDGHDKRYNQRFDSIDKSLEAANTSAKEALKTANDLIGTAMISVKEATVKQEAATAEKIDSVKSETRIRFTELEKKLDTAVEQLRENSGRSLGMKDMYGWLVAILALAITLYKSFAK